MEQIRNFSIIAHVDHGKSTLADRFLEYTGAIEKRVMQDQMLDRMELERERGITIKMQPVSITHTKDDKAYTFNIIDTPGHIDFAYEVSRSLHAVEGALLLVDATQGVQAQTLSVMEQAQEQGLTLIPTISKIDSPNAQIEKVSLELIELLKCSEKDIVLVSGKTGAGVPELLDAIVDRIPAPKETQEKHPRALVFDFSYTNHTGINAFARVFSGSFKKGEQLLLHGARKTFSLKGLGIFKPDMTPTDTLEKGMIGYFTTGIKEPGTAVVGDTLASAQRSVQPFAGYEAAMPVIWASVYPQNADAYTTLYQTLREMRLSDAAFTYEEEQSTILGKGFRCGFLGMLHLEIITERIKREANIDLIITSPSTDYVVTTKQGKTMIISTPPKFPDRHELEGVTEPWVKVSIIAPNSFLPNISQLFADYEGTIIDIQDFRNDRCVINAEMPLRELMRQFFDRLKSASSGYASLSYTKLDHRPADVMRLDILLAEEVFPAFSAVVSRIRGEREARELVEILHDTIPRALFAIKIQARLEGRIIASKTLPALRKNVTAHLYGGDITRKMKLREKQKKGKQKRSMGAKVNVPHDIFLKVIKKRGH